jgi:hypothetical protein
MGFDGLLAFLGIGVAIFAIADPVTRRAIRLFIDKRTLYGGFLLAFILIFSAKLLHEAHPILDILLQGVALLTLVATAHRAWKQYSTAHLSDATAPGLAELFRVALLEKRFSEVERVLRINRGNISKHLTAEGRRHLFDPELVRAMVDARSLIHLELLADEGFLESLENRLSVVDVVVRALVEARHSPIRSAVIRQYGGDEGHIPDPGSVRLFESTFGNPSWYLSTRADYPLLMGALEALRSGGLDAAYNSKTEHYTASQGISSRSRCVVNLAEKAHVLALSAAIEGHADGDFYVSDLLNIFSEILDRSQVRPDIWQSPPEAPTPYAWLLKEILADLYNLSRQVLRSCYSEISDSPSEAGRLLARERIIERRIAPVPRIARDLAMVWSFCVLELARADEGNVSAWFRRSWVRRYFDFLLQLRHAPHEAFDATGDQVVGLDEWDNVFVGAFRGFLHSSNEELRGRIREAIDSLDRGKGWVRNLDTFKRELGILAPEAPS